MGLPVWPQATMFRPQAAVFVPEACSSFTCTTRSGFAHYNRGIIRDRVGDFHGAVEVRFVCWLVLGWGRCFVFCFLGGGVELRGF